MTSASWWESQNWGSVPDWFAAVGTVLALALGVVLFATEVRRNKRAYADRIVSWMTHRFQSGEWSTVIEVQNTSDVPLLNVFFRADPRAGRINFGISKEDDLAFTGLRAGETHRIEYPRTANPRGVAVYVELFDAAGHTWVRDLRTNKYIPKWRWWPILLWISRKMQAHQR